MDSSSAEYAKCPSQDVGEMAPTAGQYVEYAPCTTNAVQHVPCTMTAGQQYPYVEQRAGCCWPCGSDPRPELQQVKSAFWTFMGGFFIPRVLIAPLLVLLFLVGMDLEASANHYTHLTTRSDGPTGVLPLLLLIFIIFLGVTIFYVLYGSLICALVASLRVYRLAKQFGVLGSLVTAQMVACSLFITLTLCNILVSHFATGASGILTTLIGALFLVYSIVFCLAVSVLQSDLKQLLPLHSAPAVVQVHVAVDQQAAVALKGF